MSAGERFPAADKCQREGCDDPRMSHGRRGHGACRIRSWTDWGRAQAEEIKAKCEAEGKPSAVIVRVLETLFALPGASRTCGCKRFRATFAPVAPPAPPTPGGKP